MVSLQSIDASMFPEVYPLLRDLSDSFLTEADWHNIFTYTWEKEEGCCGYGLFDNKEIVGFLGLIFSKREINNRVENFCNITSWVVQRKYRDESLSLLLPVLKLKNHTITDLTPSSSVCRILQRLGFMELDASLKLLVPFKLSRSSLGVNDYRFTQDACVIAKELKSRDLKIFQDHLHYKCHHLLAYNNKNYCYVIYTTVKINEFPYLYCHIQYISDIDIFSKYSSTIRSEIVKARKTVFVLMDARFVQQVKLPLSYDLPFLSPKLYKSSHLRPEQIDNLYSELVLLNVSTLPSRRKLWQESLRAIFPFFRHSNKKVSAS